MSKDKQNNNTPPASALGAVAPPSPIIATRHDGRLPLLRPFRIPKGIAKEILLHPDKKTFFFFLELKTLFVDGIIKGENRKYPYQRIADFLKISNANVRAKLKRLHELQLIIFENENIRVVSYKEFARIFGTEARKKHTIKRNGETYIKGKFSYGAVTNPHQEKRKYILTAERAVKAIAIKENLRKQKYIVEKKVIDHEIKNIIAERFIRLNASKPSGCSAEQELNAMTKQERKRIVRCVNKESAMAKAEKTFEAEMRQTALGLPKVNTNITLSCAGVSRLFGGLGSSATGHYQQQRLAEAGLLDVYRDVLKIPPCAAVYECMMGERSDVFSYVYPSRREGRIQKSYIRMPNFLSMTF